MRTQRNGSLAQAMALLIHNQAELVAQVAQANKERAENERRIAEMRLQSAEFERRTEERFRNVDRTLDELKTMLGHLDQRLRNLPEAVRQKIGFREK